LVLWFLPDNAAVKGFWTLWDNIYDCVFDSLDFPVIPHEQCTSILIFHRSFLCHVNYSTILPVVLYGCETWSVTLREEHRLRVFENRVLRGIFGPKRDEVTGEWRKLHSGELHNL
jgi:hypothetical protein